MFERDTNVDHTLRIARVGREKIIQQLQIIA
jgi:hypothetical protein